jgi:hypothetical protein
MNRLIPTFAAVLALAGCVTPTGPQSAEQRAIAAELLAAPAQDRAEITAGVAIEVGARFRCPATPTETEVLLWARFLFDTVVRSHVLPESAAIVDRNRVLADETCHIAVAPSP